MRGLGGGFFNFNTFLQLNISKAESGFDEKKRDAFINDTIGSIDEINNGNFNKYSDIDIAVISKDFIGNNFLDSQLLDNAVFNSSLDIEVHTFSPNDFQNHTPLVMEILNSGYKIQ